MKPLTLFIMSSDNNIKHPDSVLSFGDIVEKVVLVEGRGLEKEIKKCETEWYCYIFSNEYIEKDLSEALPLYFEQDMYDVIIFMQKLVKGDNIKFGQSPRLFKQHIRLKGMVPLNKKFKHIRALDGFIMINDHEV